MSDDILARIDQVVEDAEGFIEWQGSTDSATWAADGSHQPVELDGDYYGMDQPGSAPNALGWTTVIPDAATTMMFVTGRRQGRRYTLEELMDALRPDSPPPVAVHPVLLQRMEQAAEAAGIGLQEWQREFLARFRPQAQALVDLTAERAAAALEAAERVVEQLNPTVTGDDRRPRPKRTGRDAQTSPYPSPRRGR